jgi:hypothetical protein
MGDARPMTGAVLAGQAMAAMATGLVGPPAFAFFSKILSALESRR